MSDQPAGVPASSPARSLREWLPAISAALLILGAITSVGSLIGRLGEAERRIGALEQDHKDSDRDAKQIIDRLARIEGKLDAGGDGREGNRK